MAKHRKTTGLFGTIFNALTGTGVTVHRTRDFWGHKKTVIRDYDRGVTKKYVHGCGFWGNRTKVTVCHDGNRIGSGTIRDGFFGGHTYTGTCFRCGGTGIFKKTGKPCRKCGGTGVYVKTW